MAFLEWFPGRAPRWLRRGMGERWLASVGLLFDSIVEGGRQAIRLRFPTGAPPDALETLGEERQSPRFRVLGHELDGIYAERLRRQWDHRAWLGTKVGLSDVLALMGFTHAVYDQGEWNPGAHWSHGWVFIKKPHPWGPKTWGGGWKLGDGTTWGSDAPISDVENFYACVRPWVPAHAKLWAVVALDGKVWGDGQAWGGGWVWGGSAVAWPLFKEI